MGDIGLFLLNLSVWAIPVILAITLHEAAHGYVARLFGDPTAELEGRVTLNPIRHIDPFGTILLPALLLMVSGYAFGWAKPVPVDFSRLKPRRAGMVLVALAGPGINVLLAVLAALLLIPALQAPPYFMEWLKANLMNAIYINLLLAVFNMMPLPPLDGGRVAVGLLPRPLAMPLARLENVGMLIILGLLFLLPMAGDTLGLDLNFFGAMLGRAVYLLSNLVLDGVGLI